MIFVALMFIGLVGLGMIIAAIILNNIDDS